MTHALFLDTTTVATATTTDMSQCLDLLYDIETSMSFTSSTTAALQAVTREIVMKEPSQSNSDIVMSDVPPSFSQVQDETQIQEVEIATIDNGEDETWKQFLHLTPFLAMPPEIHLKIMSFLHPIDATCLSLVKYVSHVSVTYSYILFPHI